MREMQAEARTSLTSNPRPQGAARRTLFVRLVTVATLTYSLDQLSKWWAVATLSDGQPRPLLGDHVRLLLIRNSGAAFSIGNRSTWLMTVIACLVLAVVVWASRRIGSLGWAWALGLILGGALGNLTDRMLREPGPGRGHVVDFIDYNQLFIGNVADIAIVSAAVLIAWLSLQGIPIEGKGGSQAAGGDPGGADAAGGDPGDSAAVNPADA